MYNSLLITPAVLNHRAADRYRAAEHWPPGHRDLEKNIKETLLYAYCILLTDDEQAHLCFYWLDVSTVYQNQNQFIFAEFSHNKNKEFDLVKLDG